MNLAAWRAVAFGMGAGVMSACTLTDDAFEPSPVDSVGGGLTPAAPNEPTPPDEAPPAISADEGSESSGADGTSTSSAASEASEPALGSVPLDAPEADDGEAGASGEAEGDADDDTTGDVDPGLADGPPGEDTAPEPPVTATCPGTQFGGSCYQAFGERTAWSVAGQRCGEWGGHLASVESPEEDAFLADWPAQLGVAFADGTGIWLGGTDAALEGDFRWFDESPLSFEGWAPNQPDNGAGVDCIEKRNDGTALWYDRRCVDLLPFICERPL